jgi:hypothetical protein
MDVTDVRDSAGYAEYRNNDAEIPIRCGIAGRGYYPRLTTGFRALCTCSAKQSSFALCSELPDDDSYGRDAPASSGYRSEQLPGSNELLQYFKLTARIGYASSGSH